MALPEDLMMEIALRLPIKSIGQLKCVSKEWNLLLSSPRFAKSHLYRAPNRDRIILRDNSNRNLHVITPATTNGGRGGSSRAVRSRLLKCSRKINILASGNGLVLLKVAKTNGNSRFVVINPVTSRATVVPRYVIPDQVSEFGLGYSSVDDDIKIVALECTHETSAVPTNVNIISLKTRSCKKAESPCKPSSDHGVVCTDGRLHWLAYEDHDVTEEYTIVAFDLSTEKFEELPFPAGFDLAKLPDCKLGEIGGCLALRESGYSTSGREIHVVWVMEKPGYWRKFTIRTNYNYSYKSNWFYGDAYNVVSSLGEFEFMLKRIDSDHEKLVAYNCEFEFMHIIVALRYLDIDGLPKAFNSTMMVTFRESLLCPSRMFKGFLY